MHAVPDDTIDQTSQDTSELKPDTATLRVPSHGRGRIRTGGKPGNRGGRPRSAVREASMLAYDERIGVLAEIADDPKSKAAERVRAIDVLGKHGGITREEVIPRELVKLLAVDVQAVARSPDIRLDVIGERTGEELDAGDVDVFLSRIYAKWAMTLGAYRAGDI